MCLQAANAFVWLRALFFRQWFSTSHGIWSVYFLHKQFFVYTLTNLPIQGRLLNEHVHGVEQQLMVIS